MHNLLHAMFALCVNFRKDIPGEKSGLKYPQPQKSLLSMNQVNILKDKIISKMQNSSIHFNNFWF